MSIFPVFKIMLYSSLNYSIKNIYINRYFHIHIYFSYCRVCRQWNLLAKRPAFWKEVNVKFHKSHKSQNDVTKCFVEILPSCVACIRLDFKHFSQWAEQLNCEEFYTRLQKICPHLKKLNLVGAVLSCSIQSVIDLCTKFLPDVKILILNYCYFSVYSPRGELVVSSKIELLDLSQSWLGHFSPLEPAFSRMPHLKQLHLSNTNINYYWFEDDISFLSQLDILDVGCTPISSNAFSLIRCYGFNLKELFLCKLFLHDAELHLNNSVFPHLKTICLKHCSAVTCEGVVSLIQSCQSLQNVYVDQEVAASYAAHPYTITNKSKLEIVKFITDCNGHRRITY